MRAQQRLAAVAVALVAVGGCGTNDEVTQETSALTMISRPDQIGVFRSGTWYLDRSGNNVWDGTPTDVIGTFGQAGDKPAISKISCNPFSGDKQVFLTRGSSSWFWTFNDFDWDAGDQSFSFGFQTGPMSPVILDTHIAAVGYDGNWIWDVDDDHNFTIADKNFGFGSAGDIPVAGVWGPTGASAPGTYRNGLWIVDSNNNHVLDAGDARFNFGVTGDLPIVGDFNPDHFGDEVAVFRNGTWFVDFNGNHQWDDVAGGDRIYYFGDAGDIPVVASGYWTSNGCVH